MTPQEVELIELIRNYDDTESALNIAIEIIASLVGQHESSQQQSVVCL
jgi:hypothetical protein